MKYYVGLDMGTSSVGLAVTDTEYNLIKKKGKDFWTVHEFDEANPAVERRTFRTSRRRKQREKVRIGLLKSFFAEEIEKKDKAFFQRLDNSKYYYEDKDDAVKTKNGVFADENYTDTDYFKQYPTIFHLRKELIGSKEPKDVRLVYLAILNMFKHRGHFLNENIGDDTKGRKISDVYDDLRSAVLRNCEETELPETDGKIIEEILSGRNMSRSKKCEKLSEIMGISKKDKEKYEIIKGICGLKFDANKFLKVSSEKAELDFTSSSYDETALSVMDIVGSEAFECVEFMKEMYDVALLADILKGEKYLSFAMVRDYEKHHEDLILLKKVVKKYRSESYDFLFKSTEKGTYSAYVNSVLPDGKNKAKRRDMKERTRENIYNTIKKLLKDIDDKDAEYILKEIENETFLPKQRTSSNGVIPNQLHKTELKKILENAENYLPFLKEKDENNLTVSQRILMLFSFRVPYYIGPVTERSQQNGGNGWVVRKKDGQVLPWNIEEKIDMQKTSEEFIKRLIKNCTYISGEKVLPKASLLYEKYMVLNEINKIKIKDEPISVDLKQKIYNNLFKRGKKVTIKGILRELHNEGIKAENDDISGVDINLKSNLSSYGKFYALMGNYIDTDEGMKIAEDIIYWCTIYGDSKKFLKESIKKKYPQIDEQTLKKICGFKFKDWGKLSKELLIMEGIHKQTGEILTLIDAMWETNLNFMELINSDEYTFKDVLNEKKNNVLKTLSTFTHEDLDDMYFSAPVKKMIWQTVLLLKEVEKVMGEAPEKVFVEVTRSNKAENQRTTSRLNDIKNLYKDKDIKKDYGEIVEYFNGKDYKEDDLRNKKLYLYYKQLGRDMYTGKHISIEELFNDNLYDIDHIYPRHFVKDDSIHNNLVLVNKQHNARKSDTVPIDESIRNNPQVKQLWEFLKKKGLITEEKYKRLTRNRELDYKEKEGFIARQIVETGQGTKGIADILKQIMPDTEIIYSKAENVSEFRNGNNGTPKENVVKFPKVRILNDFHHAHDAYLNIVVGNVYDTKFTQNPANFIKELKKNSSVKYNMDKMFNWDVVRNGYCAWKAGENGTIETVKKMLSRNTPMLTRAVFERHGGITRKGTIYSKEKASYDDYIPLKATDIKLQDVKKYGGFTNVSAAYFFLVEHTLKKKRVRTIEIVPIYLKNIIENMENGLENYCAEKLGLKDFRVLVRRIPIQSLIKLNGFYVHLSGKTGDRFTLRNAVNLVLSWDWAAYIKLIENYIRYGKLSENITSEKNIELYDELCKKHNGIYSKRPNCMGEKLVLRRNKFIEISIEKQLKCIAEILKLSAIELPSADLSEIGESIKSGVVAMNKNITGNNECKLICQSPTGLYEKTVDLLSDKL